MPEAIARTYNLVPVSVSRDKLAVAMSNPMDVEAMDAVQRHAKKRVEPLLASDSRIKMAIERRRLSRDESNVDRPQPDFGHRGRCPEIERAAGIVRELPHVAEDLAAEPEAAAVGRVDDR